MNKSPYMEIGQGYFVTASGELMHNEPILKNGEMIGTETTSVSNHTPILREYRKVDDGSEITEELLFAVRRAGREEAPVPVTMRDMLGQNPHIKFGPGCIISRTRGAVAMYREAMQIQCETAPCNVVYRHTGWKMIDGKRVFLNGNFSVTENGLTDQYSVSLDGPLSNYRFTDKRDAERFSTLLKDLPKVASRPLVYAGLALAFLTPLNGLLRESGIEPRFILYFNGSTGTRKTTTAKLFLNFFGTFDNGAPSPAGFRDTPNAVEKKFSVTDSTLMLLDDRIPSTTSGIRAQMESMEQNVARQIGDRSPRDRMNADGSLRASYRPKCNLIVTSEDSYSNVGESAIARALTIDLEPGDVNLEALTKVQRNAEHLNQCMGEYIQWAIVNWDILSRKLGPLFTELRDKAQSDAHGRIAECIAHLQIGMICMTEWLRGLNRIEPSEAERMQNESWNIFQTLAEHQNKRITAEKPVKLFLETVHEMLDSRAIRVQSIVKDEPSGIPSGCMGYRDEQFYYFYPGRIYAEVRKYFDEQGRGFPLSQNALFAQMRSDGIIEPDKSQSCKLKRIGGKRTRMLWIKASKLDNIEEVNPDE